MLNRERDNQFTIFGRGVKRSHLNWGNTAFFFLVACLGGRELEKHSHKPGDDLDTFSEKFFMLLTFLAIVFYILINKKQIRACFRAAQAALTPDPPINPPRNIFIAVHIPPAEEKFASKTLNTCFERSKRIAKKIEKINESKTTTADVCPKEFECPISLQPMKCPVVASDGVTYDYDSIYPVLNTTRKSPITREMLSRSLNPQPVLQDKIETWINSQIEKSNKLLNQNIPTGSGIPTNDDTRTKLP